MAEENPLQELLVDELKDLYSAENQIIKALPRMVKAASAPELKRAFEKHLGETLVRDFVLELLFVRLRDLVVLTINTTQVTVAEEHVSGASGSDQRRLFTEVRRVG